MLSCSQANNSGTVTKWTLRSLDDPILKQDEFPELPGAIGQTKRVSSQIKVLKNFTINDGPQGLVELLKHLWPGDFTKGYEAVAKHMKQDERANLTIGEWLRFLGLLLAATQYQDRGEGLWERPSKSGMRPFANFGEYMGINKFKQIKRHCSVAFSSGSEATDPYAPIRGGVNGYNENRARTIILRRALTADETMSAFKPRTSKTGGLPHLSFIKRKPKPLGTELKTLCCGISGVILRLEIQEGKGPMRKMPNVSELGSNAASAYRLVSSTLGSFNAAPLILLNATGQVEQVDEDDLY